MAYPPTGVSDGNTVEPSHITDIINELGSNPSGSSSTVQDRLSALDTTVAAKADLSGGKVPTSQLGTGTANSTKYLRGDGVWGSASDIAGAANVNIEKAGVAIGTRPTINLIQGSNATLTVADNPGSDRVDVTIASTGGASLEVLKSGSTVGTRGKLNLIPGTYTDLTVSDNSGSSRVDVTVEALPQSQVLVNGSAVGTRGKINLVAGTNVTLTGSDVSASDRVDVTVAASGGGGSTVAVQKAGSAVGTRGTLNFIEGSNVTITASDNSGSSRVDLTIAASGGGGSATIKGLVVAADAPSGWSSLADYTCDGTADQVQINAALLAAVNSGKGGKVLLSPGTFNIAADSPIKLQGRVWLQGCDYATSIVPQGTWSDTVDSHPSAVMRMIWNSGVGSSSDVTYGEAWRVSDLRIEGGYKNCHGIYIRVQANGTFWPSAAGNKDTHARIDNLWIGNVGKDGIRGYAYSVSPDWQRIGSVHTSNVDILNPTGSGVYIEGGWVDSFWESVNVGSPGSYGFYVGDNDHYMANCKAWYSTNEGFYIAGNHNSFVGCHTQNGYKHGFRIQANANSLAGCGADADGQATGTWAGFYVVGSGNTVSGCHAVNDTSPGWLDYGYWHAGDHNIISGTWHSNGHGTAATNGTVSDNSVTVKSY